MHPCSLEVCHNYMEYNTGKKKVAHAGIHSFKVCQYFFYIHIFHKSLKIFKFSTEFSECLSHGLIELWLWKYLILRVLSLCNTGTSV